MNDEDEEDDAEGGFSLRDEQNLDGFDELEEENAEGNEDDEKFAGEGDDDDAFDESGSK